jgi:hypothetical protein
MILEMQNGVAILENNLHASELIKYRVVMWLTDSTLRLIPKVFENIFSTQMLWVTVSIIHKSKTEMIQISTNWWLDKEIVIYTCHAILFSCKNIRILIIWYL